MLIHFEVKILRRNRFHVELYLVLEMCNRTRISDELRETVAELGFVVLASILLWFYDSSLFPYVAEWAVRRYTIPP